MPPETDNLALQELFEQDQTDREKVYETPEDVKALKARDRARRKRVYVMIDLGEVSTKKDLYHSSVLLHHGDDPQDFLTAHRLSVLAAIMGHKTSRWLSAASLDRYLMSVGLPQIYGTQFEYGPDSGRYEVKLPYQDQAILSFEKEFLGIPAVSRRLDELNKRLDKKPSEER